MSRAWKIFLDTSQNKAARYFENGKEWTGEKTTTRFRIPGLQSATHQGDTVTFTRDAAKPLIQPDQLLLLKSSKVEWHRELALQLENPVWSYDLGQPILSIDRQGDEVFVNTPSEFC